MDEELTQLNLKLFRRWKLEADLKWVKSWPPYIGHPSGAKRTSLGMTAFLTAR